MKQDHTIVTLASCLLIVCGCGHSRPRPAPLTSTTSTPPSASIDYRTYSAPADTVWGAVLAALADRGYTVVETRHESRSASSDWIEVQSRELSEGKGLLAGGERRWGSGILNSIAEFPETKGTVSYTNSQTGKDGESGFSTTSALDQEVGVWSKCRHRMNVKVIPTGIEECGVEARPEIECWEQQEHKAWTPCRSKGRLESEFFTALDARLAP
jgi:hypothetical protein